MIEFEVQGEKRGFKLGTYTFKLINQMSNTKTINDVFTKMSEHSEDFTSVFYYCCAKHYAMSKKLPVDFEEVHVADWLDDLGAEKVKVLTEELFKVYLTKNLKAPETGQVLQSINGIN
jgi:hypothetical protein